MAVENPMRLQNIQEGIYLPIARKHHVSQNSVEKALRTVRDSMIKHGVVYMVAVGGAAALISNCIKKYEVLAYPELGPEAVARLTIENFPAIVAIDCHGNNFYETGQAPYRLI